ncbi:MAG TPA: hypothetical protein VIV60_22345 [Polyangiaceae bacterium]
MAPTEKNQPIIIIGDDNKYYKLDRNVWQNPSYIVADPAEVTIIERLKQFGTYLAYVRDDIAVGAGVYCTVVNLQSILRNNADPGQSNKP